MIDLKDKLWIPRLLLGQTAGLVKEIAMKRKMTGEVFQLHMDSENEYRAYPRPQMKRNSYLDLNGKWEIYPVEEEEDTSDILALIPEEFPYQIRVPYACQSSLSGYRGTVTDRMIYRRKFRIPGEFVKDRILLHFGAVDQIAEVFLNGNYIGKHEGGYLPFEFDVTAEIKLREENELLVSVKDDLDPVYPYGKQTKTPGGMWYTPVSGIWQSVWMESVPETYIQSIACNYHEPYVEIEILGNAEGYDCRLSGKTYRLKNGYNRLYLKNPHFWSPEDPYLYRFELTTGEDEIESYFAVRTITIEERNGKKRVCLNHQPYFFHGVLDQGYFPDGLFTPKSDRYYEQDIRNMKELGFNTLRKHIKIEPQIFYYDCDRLGMLVFQDMVNNGDYQYMRDTIMPTIGKKEKDDTVLSPKEEHVQARKFFVKHAKDTVCYLKSFPSIVLYTVFNEGWGQFSSKEVTEKLREIDDTRLYDQTSGWFWQGEEEICSDHVYFHKVWPMKKGDERPRLISECGGYARYIEGHIYSPEKSYGYGVCEKEEELTAEILRLYRNEILPEIDRGCFGAIYTQVSDIEEEINGLYTYDRAVCKVNKQKMRKLSACIRKRIRNQDSDRS